MFNTIPIVAVHAVALLRKEQPEQLALPVPGAMREPGFSHALSEYILPGIMDVL